jgi:hypothetical protein
MPKVAVRIFWHSDDGLKCQLRSTDQGWQVELMRANAAVIKTERVRSSADAERIARDWRRQSESAKP